MASKVLNKGDREMLQVFAQRRVKATGDHAALDAAYDACATMVRSHVDGRYPPKDMAVLKKYDVARIDRCIYVTGDVPHSKFEFRPDDERAPSRPTTYDCNNRRPYLLTPEQSVMFGDFLREKEAFDKTEKQRLQDFYALIACSRTFEILEAAWPAVGELREAICGRVTSLTLMSDEVRARITADPATQLAA